MVAGGPPRAKTPSMIACARATSRWRRRSQSAGWCWTRSCRRTSWRRSSPPAWTAFWSDHRSSRQERALDPASKIIELLARPHRAVAEGVAQAKAVVEVPWDDVEVDVEHLLAGHFAVGEEEVDPFAAQAAPAQSPGNPLSDLKDPAAVGVIELGQVGGVAARDDEGVALRDGPDVEKGDHGLIFVDKAGARFAARDAAEDAVLFHLA